MKKRLIDRLHERFASSSLITEATVEDIQKWRSFIAKFPETTDCYELAFYKYLCRMYFFSLPKRIIINLFGFGAFFFELFYLLTSKRTLKKPIKGLSILEKARDIPDFTDIVPEELMAEDSKRRVIENHNEKFGPLCKEAKKYCWECIRRHPLRFFFNYFVYMELSAHSRILLEHNPEITVVYINERNVASPILTDFYHEQGRKIYSFMHGEYAFQLPLAYMRFSRYYIWDLFYESMFSEDLRCKIDEYVIYTPKKLKKKWALEHMKPNHFCTYYLSGEGEGTLIRIADLLKTIAGCGLKCRVRPHPRTALHRKLLNDLFIDSEVEIESPTTVALYESLAYTEYVLGLKSTVLAEAAVEGKEIVLDDITNKGRFEALKLQKFNVFNKSHKLLSDLLEENHINHAAK